MSAFIIIRCDDMAAAKDLAYFIKIVMNDSPGIVHDFGTMKKGNLESVQSAVDTLVENMDEVIVLEKVEDEE